MQEFCHKYHQLENAMRYTTAVRVMLAISVVSLMLLFFAKIGDYSREAVQNSAPMLAARASLETAKKKYDSALSGYNASEAASAQRKKSEIMAENAQTLERRQAALKVFWEKTHQNGYRYMDIMDETCHSKNRLKTAAKEVCRELTALESQFSTDATSMGAISGILAQKAQVDAALTAVDTAQQKIFSLQQQGATSVEIYPSGFYRFSELLLLIGISIEIETMINVFGLLAIASLLYINVQLQAAYYILVLKGEGESTEVENEGDDDEPEPTPTSLVERTKTWFKNTFGKKKELTEEVSAQPPLVTPDIEKPQSEPISVPAAVTSIASRRKSKNATPNKQCLHCGSAFTGRPNQLFCCPEHKVSFHNQKRRIHHASA